ncbi:pentapeptide repeat-containing protein [Bailinhaonella thermotolerans]|uniref:Pentapeptide repeat-containing protein n=1 Tax=Bailinhaonella thermotolerans TaxID=1070861 RepID=A0A3A4A7Q3_9ACTN|nr:pentapeptide repeat-containing protein [Bailinhaonella thermotolerans]
MQPIRQALTITLIGSLAGTALLGWLALRLLPIDPAKPDSVRNALDGIKIVLALVAGVGGVVALVVAYRRQRGQERADAREQSKLFHERFAKAAEQLGHAEPTVKLAAVHALAALADDAVEMRQTCIDVLCAFLRMPYPPPPPEDAEGTDVEQARLAYAALREVRHTIIRLITAHLQADVPAAKSWQGHDFDFTGAVFDGGTFDAAQFSDSTVIFVHAQFSVGEVTFHGAQFSGGMISFGRAEFSGGMVSFGSARFSGGTVHFSEAGFSGGMVSFGGAEFSGGTVHFSEARFSGSRVSFGRADFSGGTVSFGSAQFSGGEVSFHAAKLSGSRVSFSITLFSGAEFSFRRALFSAGEVSFNNALFSGDEITFSGAQFSGGEVTFNGTQFYRGEITFQGARLSGSRVSFSSAHFIGGQVDLSAPGAWTVPPVGLPDRPPAGLLLPEAGPPAAAAT